MTKADLVERVTAQIARTAGPMISKKDCARVVDAFTAHVRDAVTIETVREELATTVQRTVEPTHVSVWIA